MRNKTIRTSRDGVSVCLINNKISFEFQFKLHSKLKVVDRMCMFCDTMNLLNGLLCETRTNR